MSATVTPGGEGDGEPVDWRSRCLEAEARLAAPATDEGRCQRAAPVVDAWLATLTGYPSPERMFALVHAMFAFASSEVAAVEAERDELLEDVRRMKGYVAELKDAAEARETEGWDVVADLASARSDALAWAIEAGRMRSGLERYGEHADDCELITFATGTVFGSEHTCTCGFDAALAPAAPGEERDAALVKRAIEACANLPAIACHSGQERFALQALASDSEAVRKIVEGKP